MTTALLARQLRRRRAFVEKVLDVFEQIDLISRDETGLIRIVPWHEIQSFDRDEKKRRDARDRMRRYRRRKAEGGAARCHTSEAPAGRGTAAEEAVYDQRCGGEDYVRPSAQAAPSGYVCSDETAAEETAPVCPVDGLVPVREGIGYAVSPCDDSEAPAVWDDADSTETDWQDEECPGLQDTCAHIAEPGGNSGIAPVWTMAAQRGCDSANDPSPSAGRGALRCYTAAFGQMSSRTAEELTDLARCWGDEAVCAAIDIARDNGASGIRYIRAVLVNSGGRPRRRETMYERREKEFNQYVDTMLRQIWESDGDGC